MAPLFRRDLPYLVAMERCSTPAPGPHKGRNAAKAKKTMSLIVQKFGGTSVGTIERIEQVADKVAGFRADGHDIVVVVSAMSGETNRLIELAHAVQQRPMPREMDVLLSTGEQVTTALLSMALNKRNVKAKSYNGSQVRILTDDAHTKARIREIDDQRLHAELQRGYVIVVAGFQGVDEHGNITTLGRGGSDTTAVALAAALKADECQIYTDVDGVYTTDPRVVDGARRLPKITFEEMLEMASMGSKVLQIRAVEFAGKYNVPLRVLHSFQDGPGTLISVEDSNMETPTIAGIAFNRDEAKLTIEGVPDMPGVAYRILGPIGEANIEVDVIVQNVAHDKTTDFTFTVSRSELPRAEEVLNAVANEIGARQVTSDAKIAKVSVVGVGMRSHAGVASQMFGALAAESINIVMITTSEIKISVIIEEKFLELAVRALHSSFELEKEPENENAD
jgi:aspartate kinase